MYEKSIELLNKAIADEMVAVHQYMYFHFHCDDQGYELLSGLFKRIAIQEMMHIERLADRILFLKGEVEMKAHSDVQKIHDVKEMLAFAVSSEQEARNMYNQFAIECGNAADSQSKKLFEDLVMEEEDHWSQFDDEQENLSRFSNDYLALQTIERSKRRGAQAGGGADSGA